MGNVPTFDIVGLPATTVGEAKERVRTAAKKALEVAAEGHHNLIVLCYIITYSKLTYPLA